MQSITIPTRRRTNLGVYTARIIKAGALLADTKTMFTHWDESIPTRENLERLRQENIFGKASRSRIEDILLIFSQRYLRESSVLPALVRLCKSGVRPAIVDRILYFHTCHADRLLHDVVTEVLFGLHADGKKDITPNEIRRVLSQWVAENKTVGEWSKPTIERVSQGILSTLRDFGLLTGAAKKYIAPTFLPVEAFAYVAFYLHLRQASGDRLLKHPEWKLFLLTPAAVERLFFEAHQFRLLDYHAAGSVIRIDFPTRTLEEYADVIAQRAH
jgi:hypothetical protein